MPHVSKYGFPRGLTPNVIGDFEFASLGGKKPSPRPASYGVISRVRWGGSGGTVFLVISEDKLQIKV